MLDQIFQSILSSPITAGTFFICTIVSLLLGLVIAAAHMFRNHYTKSFVITLAILPAIVQIVIMLVNGNLGTGVAVMGAFSLVRFRSVPGTAREIGSIFLAMAVGLGTGMGYIGISICVTVILCAVNMLYSVLRFGETKKASKELKITIPENLDYNGIFDDLFATYTSKAEMVKVKTTNMGSLYQLFYHVELKDQSKEKEFLDQIRCRNGNLDIVCGRIDSTKEEL